MSDAHPGQRKFVRALSRITELLGSVPATCAAFVIIVAWFTGSLFVQGHLANDSYQLLINTGTTIITFLMVFIIQNTTNRGDRATHAKLDEIILRLQKTDDALVGIEDEPESEIRAIQDAQRQDRDDGRL